MRWASRRGEDKKDEEGCPDCLEKKLKEESTTERKRDGTTRAASYIRVRFVSLEGLYTCNAARRGTPRTVGADDGGELFEWPDDLVAFVRPVCCFEFVKRGRGERGGDGVCARCRASVDAADERTRDAGCARERGIDTRGGKRDAACVAKHHPKRERRWGGHTNPKIWGWNKAKMKSGCFCVFLLGRRSRGARGGGTHLKFSHSSLDIMPRFTVTATAAAAGGTGAISHSSLSSPLFFFSFFSAGAL